MRSKLAIMISGGEKICSFAVSEAKENVVPIRLVNIPKLIVKSVMGMGFVFFGRRSNDIVMKVKNMVIVAVDREEPKALVFKIFQSIPTSTSSIEAVYSPTLFEMLSIFSGLVEFFILQ
jgi:hypothetical protein